MRLLRQFPVAIVLLHQPDTIAMKYHLFNPLVFDCIEYQLKLKDKSQRLQGGYKTSFPQKITEIMSIQFVILLKNCFIFDL